jgi:hypothetical protein
MRAEHPSIDVRLVDDDGVEVAEEIAPARVLRQDAPAEHVGIGEQV